VESEHFERACNDPRAAQIALLKRILAAMPTPSSAVRTASRASTMPGGSRPGADPRLRRLAAWIERAASGEATC